MATGILQASPPPRLSLIKNAEESRQFPTTKTESALPLLRNDHFEVDDEDFLVVSPYKSRTHLLNLRTLEESQQLLAKSLALLEPVREDFATAPYIESFNWDAVVNRLKSIAQAQNYAWRKQMFYIVVFRSRVLPSTDKFHLGALDEKAHAEATKSGGLLKYWFGLPDKDGRNLATC